MQSKPVPDAFAKLDPDGSSGKGKSRKQNILITCVVLALLLALSGQMYRKMAGSEPVIPAEVSEFLPDPVETTGEGPSPDRSVLTSAQIKASEAEIRLGARTMELDAERANHERTRRELDLEVNAHANTKSRLQIANGIIESNLGKISDLALTRMKAREERNELRRENERLKLALATPPVPPEALVVELPDPVEVAVPLPEVPEVKEPVLIQQEAPVVLLADTISEQDPVSEVESAPELEFIPVYVKGMSPVRGQSSDKPWKRLEVHPGIPSRPFSVPKEIARGELRISKIRGVSMRLREVGLASKASDPAVVPETSDGVGLEKTIGTVWFLWNPVDGSDTGPLIIEFR